MSAIASQPRSVGTLPRQQRPAVNPRLIAVTVTLATFMELLDTSIANVSLPHIAGGLSTGYDESTWVLSSYLVSNAVVLPLSAWFSRAFGRKRYYMVCVSLFTVSSLLCGLAPSLGWLIVFRVLQGVGGGGLAPSEQAILVDTFPPTKRASAFAVYSIAIVAAPAIGPTLGGWITDSWSWRWVFFINIPIGVLSLLLTGRLVSDPPEFTTAARANRSTLQVDYLGILLIAVGFGCLEVVLDKGQREDWLESQFIVGFLAVAVVALAAGVVWELTRDDPVVDLSLLSERNFALSNVFYFLFGFVLFGSTVLMPQMLQSLFRYTATDAGLVLTPGALVIMAMTPLVVRLVARVGPRVLIAVGFGTVALALWHVSGFELGIDYRTAMRARMFQGFGLSLLLVPVNIVAYSDLPKEKNNKASSLTNLFRNLGGSFGIAFVTTMLARRSQFHQSVLVGHVSPYDLTAVAVLQGTARTLLHAGLPRGEALAKARAMLDGLVSQQSAMLAFLDDFWLLGVLALAAVPLALLIKTIRPGRSTEVGH